MSASASSRSHSRGLSKFRNPLTKQPSRFFDGDSFPKQLQNSSYGKFHKALGDLRSFLPMVAFQLPRVIVLGGKSAGKSSLLENITKCPVFPRSAGLCTKMPVKLQLTQVATEAESMVSITWRGVTTFLESIDDILAEVAGIMDTLKTVVADELTVQICQVTKAGCMRGCTACMCYCASFCESL